MALKAEDYARMGRQAAQDAWDYDDSSSPAPFPRDKDYWGARAWWEAYDAEFARLKNRGMARMPASEAAPVSVKSWEGLDPSKPRTVLAKGASWPYDKKTPRGAHIEQLKAQLVEGMPPGRRKRIEAAIVRVKLRDSVGR